mgnify:CR=1 FL=1
MAKDKLFKRSSKEFNDFSSLGPFEYLCTRQFYASNAHTRPPCAACGSYRPYFFATLLDKDGNQHLVGWNCYQRLIREGFAEER